MRSNSRRTSFWERFISNRKIQREPRTNSKLQSYCNPRAWRRRQVLRKRCSARKSSPMRRNFWKRARGRRGITRICLSCYFVLAATKNLSENMSVHLPWLIDAVNVQDGGSNVIHAGSQAHQAKIIFDARPHGKQRTGNVVAVRKIVLGNDGRGFLVVHVCVRIFLFELPQRLDAVVGKDEQVSAGVHVLQQGAQNFVESNILVGKSVRADAVDAGIVPNVERRNGIQPVAGAILAGLRQKSEIGGKIGRASCR